ncbi:unnamed protein product, partial [Laminaria digitata]
QNSGQDYVDCSSSGCVGSSSGCRWEAACAYACGCTCTVQPVQPRGGLDTSENFHPRGGQESGEKDMHGREQKKACCAPPPSDLRRKGAGKVQDPRSASSAQHCCERDPSDLREWNASDPPDLRERNARNPSDLRERNTSPRGVSKGGSYNVEWAKGAPCERCIAAEEVGVDGQQEHTVSRQFVSLWSQVQCVVWHVNACLGVL